METREVVQRESFNTYYFAMSLVAGLILFEVFLGWYLVSQDYGRVSYIRILLTIAVLIGLWVQSHAARYLGAIWLLLSVTVLIWMLFAAHKVALNFAALLAFCVWRFELRRVLHFIVFEKVQGRICPPRETSTALQTHVEKRTYCSRNIVIRGCNLTRYLSFVFGLRNETAAHRRFLRARR
jgi:hypothetical protein